MGIEYKVSSFELTGNVVPLSMFLKVMSLDLKVTDYGTHCCAHCGIGHTKGGIEGSIIGFGKTPFLALREMVKDLNEHAHDDSRLFPSYPADRTKSIFIPFTVSFDWANLSKHFPTRK